MFQQIKELFKEPKPKRRDELQILDNLATIIFSPDTEHPFVLSTVRPTEIHGIGVESDLDYIYELEYRDGDLPGFENLGPNERYVTHKFFYSPNKVVFLIGGVGVGKTTFSRFLIDKLIPEAFHAETKEGHKCPGVIYFNFNNYNNVTFPKGSTEKVERSFVKLLSALINSHLIKGKYFSINQEIGEVWNEILRDDTYHGENNTAISDLRIKLNDQELDEEHFDKDPDGVIGRRKKIHEEITKSDSMLDYFAALLNYVNRKYYDVKTPCLFVVIDNVDRELAQIQHAITNILLSFADQCHAKLIFNVRQTTYYQGRSINRLSRLVDLVNYRGPSPLDVIYSRIDNFLNKGSIYEKCLEAYPKKSLEIFSKRFRFIKETFLVQERFKKFFESLSGNSIRKGLMLAQNLILNSIYDPMTILTDTMTVGAAAEHKELRLGEILRALIVGTHKTYENSGVVENIFQTSSHPNTSHFVKLRILKATRLVGNTGITVPHLTEVLKKFDYTEDLIFDSLDEMLSDMKRLIWTDTSPMDPDKTSSRYLNEVNPPPSLFSNPNGIGYITFLFKNADYLQEIMMDTFVDTERFGGSWRNWHIEDRFTVLNKFCEYLLQEEKIEIETYFRNNNSARDFERVFGDRQLISGEILKEMALEVNGILSYIIDHSDGAFRTAIETFKQSQISAYTSKITEANNFRDDHFVN